MVKTKEKILYEFEFGALMTKVFVFFNLESLSFENCFWNGKNSTLNFRLQSYFQLMSHAHAFTSDES